MKVLIVGSGGREHALAWKIRQSPLLTSLYCAPGNPGTQTIAENVAIPSGGYAALAEWAKENEIALTVVGPEAPLAEGVVDIFEEKGLPIFGPRKAAAVLESSKAFAKDVMLAAGVRTAKGAVFSDVEEAMRYVREHGAPIVVKADGLAAGKGVVVAETVDEAVSALEDFMLQAQLGESGKTVVIEKCLKGREASVIALVDGEAVIPFVVSSDYKRLLDGDKGPNTGGMGAISPTPVLSDHAAQALVESVFLPTVRELKKRGIDYRGFLYAGVMVEDSGEASILEFNCRMGDPETQVIMLRLKSDLLEVLQAAVTGKLSSVELCWHDGGAACVVVSSAGYPQKPVDGKQIHGALEEGSSDVVVFQAGTVAAKGNPSGVLTKGGRVLGVSARGESVHDALRKCYHRLEKISFEGMYFRHDIGGF